MPIAFNSFGDIVAVLKLVWQLRAALSDTTGASADIRELIIEIDSFAHTLQHIKAAIDKRRIPLEASVEHGITHALIACHSVLHLILGKIAVFREQMTTRVGAVAWRQYWAVAAWSILGGRKEVDALRTQLSEQLGVIQTYLTLSHANDQCAVLDAVEQQATTLERVYGVVQDIQLRFDVGVPTFQFYNEWTGEYFHPCTRTSLTRFMQLLELSCDDEEQLALSYHQSNDPAGIHQILQKAQTQRVMQHLLMYEYKYPPHVRPWIQTVDCCYFRERAFDQWQVLIGFPKPVDDVLLIIKHLLERKHAPNTMCNCEGPGCRILLREEIQRAQYRHEMERTLLMLNQMAALGLVMNDHAAREHYKACKGIFAELYRRPDGDYLRNTIIPLLKLHTEHQRPSGACIARLLRNGPGHRTHNRLHVLGFSGEDAVEDFLPWNPSVSVPQWLSASFATAPRRPYFALYPFVVHQFLRMGGALLNRIGRGVYSIGRAK